MAMTRKEISARCYRNRRDNGLCVNCGKPLDRNGVYCTVCRAKVNKTVMERRHWYQDNGICPRCGKVSLMGDEKVCLECNAKNANSSAKMREKNREKYNKKQRTTLKKLYDRRKEKGICTRCGKRKADAGHSTCGMCRAKGRIYKQVKYGKPDHSERFKQGLCYFCDNPIKEGYKVCEKHYQMNLQKLNNDKCREATEKIKEIEHRRMESRKGSGKN